jgi:Domain of unknown function (DUF4082)/PEP-CTERM motif
LKKIKSFFVAAALVAGLGGLACSAHADTAIQLGAGYSNGTDGNWTLGFEFTPTSNLNVTSLGDYFESGVTNNESVGLWTLDGTQLATASITGSGAPADSFQFTAITPVELSAGQTYIVGGTTGSDNYAGFDLGNFAVAPVIGYDGHLESYGAALQVPMTYYPGATADSFADFGGDFQFTASGVPEPAAWAMMLLGLGGLGVAMRSRRALAAATA